MALLTSCWFIVELIVIPDRLLLKWFYLSFYIHPFFLILCQIFLWLKLLMAWLLAFLNYICFVCLYVFKNVGKYVIWFFLLFKKVTNAEIEKEDEFFEILQHGGNENHQIAISYSCSSLVPRRCERKIIELQTYRYGGGNNLHADEDASVNDQCSSSLCSSEKSFMPGEMDYSNEYVPLSVCSSNSPPEDLETNVCVPSVCSFNHPFTENFVADERSSDSSLDPFYNNYTERMRWFDILNYDRTCGIGAILNKKLGSHSSSESTEPVDFSIPYMSWSKMARKRLLRSLEKDFETVYVGQTCLSWEALHHQYRKVEALACSSSSQNGVFYNNVAGEFQKFRVLLVRFMEDERCQGKRFWNYVKGRFSFKSLIQVPEVTGFLEEEKEGMKGEAMNNVKEVLKSIEKCIDVFWIFVKTDNKKSWWKFKSSLWTCTPVEDPKDLELLAILTRKLQKEILLKDLQGKKRCWLKRVVVSHNGEYSETKEILFTMIDMKLVAIVLQMSLISSSQLKWCQEKLDNIQFRQGKVTRACVGHIFPPS